MPDDRRTALRRIDLPQRGRERMVTVEVPESMARQLRPESAEGPLRLTNYASPPYTGETREEKFSGDMGTQLKGIELVLATLQRPWPLIGFGVRPGNLPPGGGANTLTARLWALVKGDRFLIVAAPIVGGTPLATVTQFAGAQCELTLQIPSTIVPASVAGIRGTLWGSLLSDRY